MLSVGLASLQLALDRGEELDWFSSTEIIVECAVAGLCLTTFYAGRISLIYRGRDESYGNSPLGSQLAARPR